MFHVGDVVRKLRNERGWTLEDLAVKASTNKGTISMLERGEGNPRLDTLLRVAEALGVVPERLFPGVAAFETGEDAGSVAAEALSPEAQDLARAYDALTDVNSRRLLLEMAERFRAAEPPQPAAADSSQGSASGTPAKADEELPSIRRTRGA